ncbi:hypothetical protein ES702_02451 [subsurface metagenome]
MSLEIINTLKKMLKGIRTLQDRVYAIEGVPAGVIVMWSGTLATIPDDWALCDGGNGTPDLRDKFILGCPDGVNPGDTGGSSSHSHTVNAHSHTVNSHGHTIGSHSHTVNNHTHTIGSHSHTVNSHYHTVSSHIHSGGDLEFHRSITLISRASLTDDCLGLTSGTTAWGLRPKYWYGATGGAAPNTNSKSPGTSSVAPSCGGATPGTSSVAPSCSPESPGTNEQSPGTDSKNHLPPYYKLAFIMKT